jgi:phenylacetate-CoA ligase
MIGSRLWFARFSVVHARSRARQEAWQRQRLTRLVSRAYSTVPFWKNHLDAANVDPMSVTALEDLQRIPTTSKQSCLGRRIEEYIDSTRPARAVWYLTSGTSGTPFRFLTSDLVMNEQVRDFASLRFLWWLGRSPARLATTRLARVKIRAPENPYRLFVPVGSYLTDPRTALQRIGDFGPEVLSAYPSILSHMAESMERGAAPRLSVPFVLSFGEMLEPSVRTRVATAFGAEVYDRYGLEEIGVVGLECAAHDGFHVNTESVIVEIVDESSRPLPPGVEGRVVVTDLFNFNMPFIRYDSGDVGVLNQEPCACGLRSPRIRIRGRYTAFLQFPSRRIHHLEFDGAMDGFMNDVYQYQIAKLADESLLVRVVPGPSFSSPVVMQIERNLRALAGNSVRIRVECVQRIPITESGKSRIVVDESGKQGS